MDDRQAQPAVPASAFSRIVTGVSRWLIERLGGNDRVAWAALALLFAAIALRIWHFASGRSLWLDEAMVATSIVQREWQGLLEPLEYAQVAPIGWLWLEKAALQAVGGLEYALRLPQLIFGLGALLLFTAVARRLFAHAGFLVALALFAFSAPLIQYSAEVKPYGMDAFISVAFLFFGVRYFVDRAPLTAAGLVALAVLGAVAVVCSFPAVIVMACMGTLLLAHQALQRRTSITAGVAIVGVVWLSVFAYFFLNFYKVDSQAVEAMSGQWDGAFAPFPPTSVADVKWYGEATHDLFEFMFGTLSTVATAIAAAIGGWAMWRKNAWFAASVLGVFVVALIVSALQLYPIGSRLSVYLLPQLILLVAMGVDASVSAIRQKTPATWVAAGLVLAGSATAFWQNFTYFPLPYTSEHIRPVLEEVAARKTSTQPIYVDRFALPAFNVYRGRVGLADATVIEGKPTHGDLGCLLTAIDALRGHGQVWVVYSHSDQLMNQPEDAVFRYFAQLAGREVFALSSVSVHAFLMDFDSQQADSFASLLRALPPKVRCG